MGNRLGPAIARTCLFLAGLGALGAEAVALIKLRHHAYTLTGALVVFVAPFVLGIVLVRLALRLPAHRAQRLVLELVLLALCIPVVEAGLTAVAWNSPSAAIHRFDTAAKLGIPFDHRDKSQVVDDLRAQGIEAYPGMPRDLLWQADVKQRVGSEFYPLSQVANRPIVDCNESGKYRIYLSDDYGFNNPPGLYDAGRADIAAVGSSYALGFCVPPGREFVSVLRQHYARTLNFGMAGSHVPTMYAALREYVAPLHPPIVLWVMYPSAIESYELDDPIMHSYLRPDFSQHLLERHADLDRFMREVVTPVQWDLDRKSLLEIANADHRRWRQIPRLPILRDKLVPAVKSVMEKPPALDDYAASVSMIAQAKDLVEGWGGHLVIVLIPIFDEVVNDQIMASQSNAHMLSLLAPLHLHVINGVAYFRQQRDPATLYAMGMTNHFNENGHRLFADYVDADLRATYPDIMAAAAR
jgi:hypothetical protein